MQKGKEAVETLGFSVIDGDGDQTTPLIDHRNVPLLVLIKRYRQVHHRTGPQRRQNRV